MMHISFLIQCSNFDIYNVINTLNMHKILLINKIVAVSALAIGIIHCAATPIIMKDIPSNIWSSFLFMFLMAGLLLIYIGINLFVETKRFNTNPKTSLIMMKLSTITLLIIGTLIVFFVENIFALITLGIALLSAVNFILKPQYNENI